MRSELKGAARKELLHCPPCMSSAGCPSLSYSAFRPTLHMRAATRLLSKLPVYTVISTRAPRAGSDTSGIVTQSSGTKFQSTLPVRGATSTGVRLTSVQIISIHAPRAGSDYHSSGLGGSSRIFQSTLPVRGATTPYNSTNLLQSDFNPRSPCGERRPPTSKRTFSYNIFQSTLPVRGATRAARRSCRKSI